MILSGVLYTQLLDDLRTLVRGEVQNTLSAPVIPVTKWAAYTRHEVSCEWSR